VNRGRAEPAVSLLSFVASLFVIAAHGLIFTEPPPVPEAAAAAAEEEPEDVESVEAEDDFEVVDLNDFGEAGQVGEVGEVGEVEMVEIPPPKKASVKASSSAAQQVTLPYTLAVIEDQMGYKYVRLEIHLLSGMTEQTIHAFVGKARTDLNIKYYLPTFCTDPERLDELGQDAVWLFNTNVKTVYAKQGRAVETAFKNDPVYCMQTIKLPFACEQTFSKAFGGRPTSQYVKMIQHEDATFARNSQFYYYLVIHLDAVEKPVEIEKAGPQFVVSKKPAARRTRSANPFEAVPVEEPSGGDDFLE
jgi:hypothetical protein